MLSLINMQIWFGYMNDCTEWKCSIWRSESYIHAVRESCRLVSVLFDWQFRSNHWRFAGWFSRHQHGLFTSIQQMLTFSFIQELMQLCESLVESIFSTSLLLLFEWFLFKITIYLSIHPSLFVCLSNYNVL